MMMAQLAKVELPQVVEVEKVVEVDKALEVEKAAQRPQAICYDRHALHATTFDFLELPQVVEVEKVVEVGKVLEVEKAQRPQAICYDRHALHAATFDFFCMQGQWTLARKSQRRVGMMMTGVQIGEEIGATWPAL